MQELSGRGVELSQRSSILQGDDTGQASRECIRPPMSWASGAAPWRTDLGRVIQGEILPRLLLTHELAARESSSEPSREPENFDIADFARRLIADDADGAWRFVSNLLAEGRASEEILLGSLAPAARHLGGLWESDHCDFIEVTVGLRRLQEILRRLTGNDDESLTEPEEARRAMFLPTPGETHVFGVNMVESFFRSVGWRVQRGEADFLAALRRQWFDIIGFSLSDVRRLTALRSAVASARAASMNPSILILVGGSLFAENPELVAEVGADATAADGPSAIHVVGSLLGRPAPR